MDNKWIKFENAGWEVKEGTNLLLEKQYVLLKDGNMEISIIRLHVSNNDKNWECYSRNKYFRDVERFETLSECVKWLERKVLKNEN